MMYGNWGAWGGVSVIGTVTWLVIVIDLVLLGLWLWKQIKK